MGIAKIRRTYVREICHSVDPNCSNSQQKMRFHCWSAEYTHLFNDLHELRVRFNTSPVWRNDFKRYCDCQVNRNGYFDKNDLLPVLEDIYRDINGKQTEESISSDIRSDCKESLS